MKTQFLDESKDSMGLLLVSHYFGSDIPEKKMKATVKGWDFVGVGPKEDFQSYIHEGRKAAEEHQFETRICVLIFRMWILSSSWENDTKTSLR